MRCLVLTALVLFAGCADRTSDPFFRVWTAAEIGESIDLRSGVFSGTPDQTHVFPSTAYDLEGSKSCTCDVWIKGDYSDGVYSISQCVGSGPYDDGTLCGDGQVGTYSATEGALSMCANGDPDECVEYR